MIGKEIERNLDTEGKLLDFGSMRDNQEEWCLQWSTHRQTDDESRPMCAYLPNREYLRERYRHD